MLRQTLAQARLDARQIDLIKVRAGSIANDAIEAHALRDFFYPVPPLLSLKPLIGHTLGASGAAEIALLQGIRASALLAWVDEEPEPVSRWIWLEDAGVDTEVRWQAGASIFQTPAPARWLGIGPGNSIFHAS